MSSEDNDCVIAGTRVWIRRLGNAKAEWWVCRENKDGKTERVASTIDPQIAQDIFDKLIKD